MLIASGIKQAMENSSWIRKMFEDGARLKAEIGADKVFDFSLGNPNLQPPAKLNEVLKDLITEDAPGAHGYMPNAGFADVRAAVARKVSKDHGAAVTAEHVVMSVGAGGAINSVLRAILERGDEILVPRPFFVEYVFYADNHCATLKSAPTTEDFDLDVDALEREVTAKTRAVIINSPNNPTGRVYTAAALASLGKMLEVKSREFGRPIYLIADEPYRAVAYDGIEVPPVFPAYAASIVCYSFSKDLSLAGERIGYVAVNPGLEGASLVAAAITLTTRILGFVNAPAMMQRAVARLLDEKVDIGYYKANRDILHKGLTDAGYVCRLPEGAFYLFVKSPVADDVAFCRELLAENILAVPGTGFFGPGHIRLAYCCSRETAERSLPGFVRAIERVKGK